jgi:alpha-N-arabinofuranosidase
MDLDVVLRGFGQDRRIVTALQMSNPNFKAVNTKDEPNAVIPQPIKTIGIENHAIKARLAPGSWSVIVTSAA